MNRFALPFALLSATLVAQLVGCAAHTDADPNARPDHCQKNECDVAYAHCKATHAPPVDYCQQCNNECNTVSYDVVADCLATCSDICSHPSPPDTYCEDQQSSCQRTTQNAVCADGLDPANVPSDVTMTASWKPPSTPHSGSCKDADLVAFRKACGSSGSTSACQTFEKSHPACTTCAISQAAADTWGALVAFPTGSGQSTQSSVATNDQGCVAAIAGDPSDTGCGAKLYARYQCESRCAAATDGTACLAFADAHDCKAEVDAAVTCLHALGADVAGSAYDVCHIGAADDDAMVSLIGFFCGN